MWSNFIKTTFRNLNKNKSYTLVNIFGLSIALAVFIALVLYIQYELSFDNFQKNADQLYRVEQIMLEGGRSERMEGGPTPLWKALKDEFPEIIHSIRFVRQNSLIETPDGGTIEINGFFTDNEFLEMFTYEVLQGDFQNPLIVREILLNNREIIPFKTRKRFSVM